MNREEFLQKLQEALSGEVPPEVVRDNLKYYSGYLRDEQQKGRSEEEILEELGDPRLIARTIIDTTPGTGDGEFEAYRGGFGFDRAASSQNDSDSAAGRNYGDDGQPQVHYYDLNKWYWKLLGILLAVGILTVVIAVISGILTLLIPMLPLIAVVIIIMWFIQGR